MTLTRSLMAVGLAVALAVPLTGGLRAEVQVRWKMQSTVPAGLPVLGEAARRFVRQVETLSGGSLRLRLFEPNALVPALEGFDAVRAGSLESLWGISAFHAGKIPAAAWFTAVPFGPPAREYLAWMRYGGGDEIYDEIYAAHGVKGLHCNVIVPEASGWFRAEIRSADDLRGLKVRFSGLGARVLEKTGASTQLLAPGDIFPALERGTIDATEFSLPEIDLALGLHQVAKHYYFPGWHQQASVGELLVNLDYWRALSERQRATLEVACGDSLSWTLVRSEAGQPEALRRIQAHGVTLHRWPDEILRLFEAKWREVVAEESARDPLFKRLHESYSAFRSRHSLWRAHGYLD